MEDQDSFIPDDDENDDEEGPRHYFVEKGDGTVHEAFGKMMDPLSEKVRIVLDLSDKPEAVRAIEYLRVHFGMKSFEEALWRALKYYIDRNQRGDTEDGSGSPSSPSSSDFLVWASEQSNAETGPWDPGYEYKPGPQPGDPDYEFGGNEGDDEASGVVLARSG